MCSLFKVDTKGSCLLCFRSQNGDDDRLAISPAFKMLLRYLRVDMAKLPLFSSTYQRLNCPALTNVDLSVSLCEDCSSVTNDFFELFQTYEGIRIQMDLCVGQLIEFMENGRKDEESIREYQRRVSTGDFQDLISTTIAEGLRKETKEKAFQKVASSLPRVQGLKISSDDLDGKPDVPLNGGPVQPNPEHKTSFVAEVNQTGNGKCDPEDDDCSLPASLNLENESRSSLLQMIRRLSNNQRQSLPTRSVNSDTPEEKVGFHKRLSTPSKCDSELINTDTLESTPPTKPADDPSHFKCNYCGKQFTQERNLTTHHYHSHTMSILKDKQLLPPNISEQLLNTSLEQVLEQSMNNQCPVCKKAGFRWKFQVRSHLLQNHFPQIMEKIQGGKNYCQKIPKILLRWKCAPCGKDFPSQRDFDLHQFRKHPMAALSQLPSDISENQLEAAVVDMLTQSGYCKICKKGRSPTIDQLRKHLLLKHLPRLIDNARRMNDVSTSTGNELPPAAIRRSSRMLEREAKEKRKDLSSRTALRTTRRRRKPGPISAIKNKYKKKSRNGGGVANAWKCVPCRANFPTKFRLDDHQLQKHTLATLKSRLPRSVSSGTMVASLRSLVDQMKKVSRNASGGYLFQCLWCEKRVWLSTRVKEHLLKCHLKQVVQVMGGNEEGKSGESSSVDCDEAEMPSQTKCEYCDKEISNKYHLETHKWAMHTFAHLLTTGRLPTHVTKQHLNKILADLLKPNELNIPPSCQICKQEGFRSTCRLRVHLILKHLDEIVNSVVDLANGGGKCQPTTSRRAQVSGGGGKRYLFSTTRPGPSSRYQCNSCSHKSPSVKGLRIHYAKVHHRMSKAKQPTLYKCDHCETNFTAQPNLNVHLISSHPTKAFEGTLPIWATDHDFNNAVAWISRMGEKIVKDPGNGSNILASYLFECPLCKQQLDRGNRLKHHIARYHLDHVVNAMEGGNYG